MPSLTQSERPLSTPELDRLEQLLISESFHEEAMPLDMLQGLLCAVSHASGRRGSWAVIVGSLGLALAFVLRSRRRRSRER